MLSETHHKRRYSRYFMAPLWIALALCAVALAFLLGGYLVTDEWAKEDKDTLTESPLERAAEGVKHDRIEFSIYRICCTLPRRSRTSSAHAMAFRSIRDVLSYGGAVADDLKAELKGMAPQVFITTTTTNAGVAAGEALEKELRKAIGMTVVDPGEDRPAQIGGSKVSCYGAETCKDAKWLVVLLRGRGYDVREPDTSSRSEDNSDDMAASLYGAKVIRSRSWTRSRPSPWPRRRRLRSTAAPEAEPRIIRTRAKNSSDR